MSPRFEAEIFSEIDTATVCFARVSTQDDERDERIVFLLKKELDRDESALAEEVKRTNRSNGNTTIHDGGFISWSKTGIDVWGRPEEVGIDLSPGTSFITSLDERVDTVQRVKKFVTDERPVQGHY